MKKIIFSVSVLVLGALAFASPVQASHAVSSGNGDTVNVYINGGSSSQGGYDYNDHVRTPHYDRSYLPYVNGRYSTYSGNRVATPQRQYNSRGVSYGSNSYYKTNASRYNTSTAYADYNHNYSTYSNTYNGNNRNRYTPTRPTYSQTSSCGLNH